jgi:alpha-tubulin suppressor-like RCC1 family protein
MRRSYSPDLRQRVQAAARALLLFVLMPLLGGCGDSPTGPGAGVLTDPMRALAVGEEHACVLTEEGEAYCWGSNGSGQLGTGTLAGSATPVRVAGGRRFVAIHAGFAHSCALTADGEAYCWGSNRFGELGTGSSAAAWEPTPVAGGLRFTALDVGGFQHTCGRTADGRLFCWGGDRNAQLGFPTTETCAFGTGTIGCSRTPQQVPLAGEIAAVSAGFLHTCTLQTGGVALCWGDNAAGQLGIGSTGQYVPPTAVAGTVRFSALSSGSLHGCGLDAGGRAHCWGDGSMGALGTGSTTTNLVPAAVDGDHVFRQISVSRGNIAFGHSCAVTSDGRAYCWGANSAGQLGNTATGQMCTSRTGTVPCSHSPRAVDGTESWAVVASGPQFTCGISTGGAGFCWGLNASGQLGTGDTQSAATPRAVGGALRLPRAMR